MKLPSDSRNVDSRCLTRSKNAWGARQCLKGFLCSKKERAQCKARLRRAQQGATCVAAAAAGRACCMSAGRVRRCEPRGWPAAGWAVPRGPPQRRITSYPNITKAQLQPCPQCPPQAARNAVVWHLHGGGISPPNTCRCVCQPAKRNPNPLYMIFMFDTYHLVQAGKCLAQMQTLSGTRLWMTAPLTHGCGQ